ncbi:MAG: RNA polymerase sporulation sigma factor SigK [Firmicutes bacterium]|nr:RNA polymerase sporulation sigma factor SigK [Bacillota bacterium]
MIFESLMTFLSKVLFFTGYINNNTSFPKPLTAEEEKKTIQKMKDGDAEAREILIRHNLRLVAHIVKKYSNVGEAEDLISVGSIGLIKAIESYEFDKGSALATYAARCIDNEILMYIRANKKHKSTVSIYEKVGVDKEGNEISLLDIIPHKDDNVFGKVESGMVANQIYKAVCSCLNEREQEIINMRYGIGTRIHTQLEVASKLGISRSYISRIEKKAIKKINEVVEK